MLPRASRPSGSSLPDCASRASSAAPLVHVGRTVLPAAQPDVRQPEVSLHQFGIFSFAPSPYPLSYRLGTRLRLRISGNEVIGKCAVTAVIRGPADHVTAHAFVDGLGMATRHVLIVTAQTTRPVVRVRILGLSVSAVACTAPHLLAGSQIAPACRELLEMADDLEATGLGSAEVTEIYREDLFQAHAGPEIAERVARIQHSFLAAEMALLANAVAFDRRQVGRIDDRVCGGSRQVRRRRAVAAVAGDGLQLQDRIDIPVLGEGNRFRAACMAPKALVEHGPVEIRSRVTLEAGSHAPHPTLRVIGKRRLIEVVVDPNEVSERRVSGNRSRIRSDIEP